MDIGRVGVRKRMNGSSTREAINFAARVEALGYGAL